MIINVYKKIIFLILLLTVLSQPGYAQTETELFNEGNRYYQNGMYIEALQAYMQILDSGSETGELYYNIGNTYYKLDEIGRAVLYYEKARRLIPEDEDLLTNIELVSTRLIDKITPIPEVFYVAYWNKFRNIIPAEWWKNIFIAAWWLIAVCVSVMFFARRRFIRNLLKWCLSGLGFVVILTALIFISETVMDKPGQDGVIMETEVRVYASPTETGTEVFIIHEGTKVHIKRRLEDWIEVSLADGKVGWIPADAIEII